MAEDPKNPFSGVLGSRGKIPEGGGGVGIKVVKLSTHPALKAARMRSRAEYIAKNRTIETSKKNAAYEKGMREAGMGPTGADRISEKHFGKPSDTFKVEAANALKGKPPAKRNVLGQRNKIPFMSVKERMWRRVRHIPLNDNYKTGGKP